MIPFEISSLDKDDYSLSHIEVTKSNRADTVNDYFKKDEEILCFEVKVYPQEILRVREIYPGYLFREEFENDGITLEVFEKEEENGEQRYVVYFYDRNLLGGLYRENPVKSRNYEAVKSSKKWKNVGNSYIIPALLLYRHSYI